MFIKGFYLFSFLVILFLVGCFNTTGSTLDGKCKVVGSSSPAWVCGNVKVKNKFLSVGISTHIADQETEKLNAINDAKNGLIQQLYSYILKLKDSNGLKSTINTQQDYVDLVKYVINNSFKRIVVSSFWKNPNTNNLYVLVTLDKDVVDNNMKLASEVKK